MSWAVSLRNPLAVYVGAVGRQYGVEGVAVIQGESKLDSIDRVEIRLGLADQYRRQAAELYYEAFRQKFEPIMNSQEDGVAILEESFAPDLGIIALCRDELVGAAGLKYGGRDFVHFKASGLVRQYGWLRGLFKLVLLYVCFAKRQTKDELTIDSIVVHPAMRGKGIGTRLLEAVFDYARAGGFRSVRLEVVDTNPGARHLYERMGFVPTETHKHPYLRRVMGFSASITMVREVT